MTPILETPRLKLRAFSLDDLDELAAMVADPEQMRFYPRPRTRREATQWIDRNIGLYAEHGFGSWRIESRSTSEFLGYCGIRPLVLDGTTETEIGWHVKKTASPRRDVARPSLVASPAVTAADLRLPCRGLLIDCDGVLVDSDASVARSWGRWATAYELDAGTVSRTVHGRRTADTVGLLIAAERREEAKAAIDRFELEDVAGVGPIAGAVELTRALPAGGWAVVTSGVSALARARLASARIVPPAVLVSGDDVGAGKPAPDGYLRAARALGLEPADAIVIEDSATGVAAGRAAGAGTVLGVGERALETEADVVVADLRPVRWDGDALAIPAGALLRGGPGS